MKFNCSSLSQSFNHALVLRENGSGHEILDNFWIIFRVFSLSFSISLHHHTFITVLLGHQVLSSIQLNKSEYSFWIFSVALTKVSSFHQYICRIGFCHSVVRACLITWCGLIKNPSTFINSVRNPNESSFFQYFSKIFLVINLVAQFVIQSMGAKHSCIRCENLFKALYVILNGMKWKWRILFTFIKILRLVPQNDNKKHKILRYAQNDI